MRPIAIVTPSGCNTEPELHQSITCLISAGILTRSTAIDQAFALLWVDDDRVMVAVDELRAAGFEAIAIIEND